MRQNNNSSLFKTKVYRNPVIDKLSRTHISIPLIFFLSVSVFLVRHSVLELNHNSLTVVSLFVIGTILFSLVEYLIHRYLYHMPLTTIWKRKFIEKTHGAHHLSPNDKDRLAMPVPASIALAIVFFVFYKVLMGNYVYAFLPGFLTGYACYLGVHYMVHAYRAPNNFFKALWINHSIHHYKQSDKAFGVSSPLWDYVFRTTPDEF